MRYFLINEDKKLTERPQLLNWYQKIPEQYLTWGTYHKVPEKTVLYVKENSKLYFPDIMTFPFLMINKKLKSVLDLYEPNMGYRQVILIDKKHEYAAQYFLPHLQKFDCISDKSVFNTDHSYLVKPVLNEENLKDKCIFELAGVKNRHIITRLDFLESVLRRGAVIQFSEVGTERRGDYGRA